MKKLSIIFLLFFSIQVFSSTISSLTLKYQWGTNRKTIEVENKNSLIYQIKQKSICYISELPIPEYKMIEDIFLKYSFNDKKELIESYIAFMNGKSIDDKIVEFTAVHNKLCKLYSPNDFFIIANGAIHNRDETELSSSQINKGIVSGQILLFSAWLSNKTYILHMLSLNKNAKIPCHDISFIKKNYITKTFTYNLFKKNKCFAYFKE